MCGEYCKTRCTKTCMTDLDHLKHHIRTEWAKLDHAIIAAAVHRWRRRLSGCVKAGGGHFEHVFDLDTGSLYLSLTPKFKT